jgi:hypothetical protein
VIGEGFEISGLGFMVYGVGFGVYGYRLMARVSESWV